MNASPPTTVRCSLCNGELTVVSMTGDGATWQCPCQRTTWTYLNAGHLDLGLGAEPQGPIVDRDPGDEQP